MATRSVRLFELGKAYLPTDQPLPREPERVAALLSGPVRPSTWRDQTPPEADFFAAKGALAVVLGLLRVDWTVEPGEASYDPDLGEFVLPYRAVRTADDPDGMLLAFLRTTYEAAAELGGWDRAALETS